MTALSGVTKTSKSNYDCLRTIIRKTNKNYYRTRADLRSANAPINVMPAGGEGGGKVGHRVGI